MNVEEYRARSINEMLGIITKDQFEKIKPMLDAVYDAVYEPSNKVHASIDKFNPHHDNGHRPDTGVTINPNCSEVVFHLSGTTIDDAIATLKTMGIEPGLFMFHDESIIDCITIGIMNDRLFDDNRDVKAMLDIERRFHGEWEPSTGSTEFYDDWKRENAIEITPNCSEIVIKLPGMSRQEALAVLRDHGIIEVNIPLKLLSGDENEDVTWDVLADRDNQLVPNLDSECGCAQITVEDWDGTTVIRGGLNLEFSSLPTLDKIEGAFPGRSWKEVTGGGMTGDLAEWKANGKKLTTRQEKLTGDDVKEPGKDTKLVREKIVDPAFKNITINPNCSEIVMELPGMPREVALAKLREVGIIEVEIPENVMYDRESETVTRVIVDRDNPNCPDFTFREIITLHETSGHPGSWRSRVMVRDVLFQLAYARKKPDIGAPEAVETELRPENGKVIIDIAAEFKKPRPSMENVCAIIDTWPEISDDGKWHLKSVFSNRSWFKDSPGDPSISNLQRSRVLEIVGNGMIDGTSIDAMTSAIHEKYPEFDTPSCYFTTGSSERSMFPTVRKIGDVFHRDWHGYDGGNIGTYDDWEEEMRATGIVIKMRGRGKTDEQVVAYLEENYLHLSELIDLVKRGEPISTMPVDHQGTDSQEKRERYCRFDAITR